MPNASNTPQTFRPTNPIYDFCSDRLQKIKRIVCCTDAYLQVCQKKNGDSI